MRMCSECSKRLKEGYTIDFYCSDECREANTIIRKCSECNEEMSEGYCIDNGLAYYCTDECLEKNMTREEFLELYDDGEGDSYWTEWEE